MGKVARVLAIDAARQFGWAYGSTDGAPESGFGEFGVPGNQPEIFGGALRWMNTFLKEHPVDMVVIEKPNAHLQKVTNFDTMLVLMGLVGCLQGMTHTHRIHRQLLVDVQDCRRYFIGRQFGNAKGDRAKALVRQRCIELGFVPRSCLNTDQTDALAVWSWTCGKVDPDNAVRFSPLFTGL